MQNKRLEAYLNTLAGRLTTLTPTQREEEILEVRQHLEALAQWHLQQGKGADEAMELAVLQFGQAERLGRDLNKTPVQERTIKNGLNARQYFCLWFGIAAFQFLFFTWINDKPTDFPFQLEDRVLMAATLAVPALSLGNVYRRLRKKQA